MYTCTKPTRPLLPPLRKALQQSLSKDERRELRRVHMRMVHLIEYIEIDEEEN